LVCKSSRLNSCLAGVSSTISRGGWGATFSSVSKAVVSADNGGDSTVSEDCTTPSSFPYNFPDDPSQLHDLRGKDGDERGRTGELRKELNLRRDRRCGLARTT
jgi:hypothetical protein